MRTTLQRARNKQSRNSVWLRARPTQLRTGDQLRGASHATFSTDSNYRPTLPAVCPKCSAELRSRNGSLGRNTETTIRPHVKTGSPRDPSRHLSTTARFQEPGVRQDDVHASLKARATEKNLDDLEKWTELFRTMRTSHGDAGVWACFELLRDRHSVYLLLKDSASKLRSDIVEVAVTQDKRIDTLLTVVTRLRAFQQDWPELYESMMSALLREDEFARAIDCHHRLSESIHPGSDAVAELLSNFILDSSEDMQSCLRTIYNFSSCRDLYGRLIPVIYDAGRSRLARDWRGLFLRSDDWGALENCWPFLTHLQDFYPLIRLTEREREVLRNPPSTTKDVEGTLPEEKPISTTTFRDEFVAKTFASRWISLDFGINTIQRLGFRVIGARALQALALREGSADGVALRMKQLEKLGLEMSSKTYCKALVVFARNGEEKLLQQLVECDVHPDEFDTADSRRLMMEASKGEHRFEMESLLHGVDWAVENQTGRRAMNRLLSDVLGTGDLGKIIQVITRMDSLKVSATQRNIDRVLHRSFWRVKFHQRLNKPDWEVERHDRAIVILRRLLQHDAAIPIMYWKRAFYVLGRLGRFEEWLQLALELVARYKPEEGGLVPMHPKDRPRGIKSKTVRPSKRNGRAPQVEGDDAVDEEALIGDMRDLAAPADPEDDDQEPTAAASQSYRIPADLPLSHRQHPLNKIFDDILQRAIIRWGFDQTLHNFPAKRVAGSTRLKDYDIALGVRILKVLEDHGVLVTKDVVRSVLAQRTVMAQLPQRRHRARDSNEVEAENVYNLVEAAWGPGLLFDLESFEQRVARARTKFWTRGNNSIEFQNAHDPLPQGAVYAGASRKHNNLARTNRCPPSTNWLQPSKPSRRSQDYDNLREFAYPNEPGETRLWPDPSRLSSESSQSKSQSTSEQDPLDSGDTSKDMNNRFTREWKGPQW